MPKGNLDKPMMHRAVRIVVERELVCDRCGRELWVIKDSQALRTIRVLPCGCWEGRGEVHDA